MLHKDCDWSEYLPDTLEELPTKSPPPFSHRVHLATYVDADHACDNVSCHSVTGVILLLNNTPIAWISK